MSQDMRRPGARFSPTRVPGLRLPANARYFHGGATGHPLGVEGHIDAFAEHVLANPRFVEDKDSQRAALAYHDRQRARAAEAAE